MATVENAQRRRKGRDKAGSRVIRLQTKDRLGNPRLITADLIDQSEEGLGVSLLAPLPLGSVVLVRGVSGEGMAGERHAAVKWCTEQSKGGFQVGLEFVVSGPANDSAHHTSPPVSEEVDWYEVMQLSPNADSDTIGRVYRILAQRYHPDSATGNQEAFVRLCEAHRILSNPELRASYDGRHRQAKQLHWEIFDRPELPSRQEAEKRKRQTILEALYAKSLTDPERGSMTAIDFEELLGCPREHLEAALWYLRAKNYVKRADNGRFSITVSGFDAVEELTPAEPHSTLKMLSGVRR